MRIHPIGPTDRDDWQRLWDDYLVFYETRLDAATTESTFARLLDPAVEMHGAIARDEAGAALGFAHWIPHAATWTRSAYCYLEDLYVAPDARGAGAGSALISHVRDWAQAQGLPRLYWVTAEDNHAARSLYDRVATRSGNIEYEIQLEAVSAPRRGSRRARSARSDTA